MRRMLLSSHPPLHPRPPRNLSFPPGHQALHPPPSSLCPQTSPDYAGNATIRRQDLEPTVQHLRRQIVQRDDNLKRTVDEVKKVQIMYEKELEEARRDVRGGIPGRAFQRGFGGTPRC